MSINIYQVFTRLFRNDSGKNIPFGSIDDNGCSKFNHFTNEAIQAIKNMGFTHIWFTGIIRHASCTEYEQHEIYAQNPLIVKGRAGSPYAIKDYFDVCPDLAEDIALRMNEFESLIERCHKNDIKVIIDFVPNHVSREYKSTHKPNNYPDLGENDDTSTAFSPQNNFYYLPGEKFELDDKNELPYSKKAEPFHEFPAKATGNDVFCSKPSINDWYETIKLNYGVDVINNRQEYFNPVPDTWIRMYEILEYWAAKKIDGFRVDMAEMVPLQFWSWVIPKIKEQYEDITFTAEVYDPNLYRSFIQIGKFDYLYDKEQFYNILRAILEEKAPASAISSIWKEQEGISKHMLRFMENHDEQRIGSGFFMCTPKEALPAITLASTMQDGPLMVYFGQEIGITGNDNEGFSGKDGRTSIFDYWKIEDYQKWVNTGRFNNSFLNKQQNQIRNFYLKLLMIRNTYPAFQHGQFYDLMYANQHIDSSRIYVFLRNYKEQIFLIVLNFDKYNTKKISVKIPYHAWEFLNIQRDLKLFLTNILDTQYKTESTVETSTNKGITMELQKSSSMILEIGLRE